MDGGSISLLITFIILVILSAFFACAESSMSLINKIRIKQKAENGDRQAKHALYISNHFDKALTTLLIGINITHIAAASVATLFVMRVFENLSENSVDLVSTLSSTFILFLFGEMIPKSLANDRSETLSRVLASPLRILMKLFTPLSAFFTWIGATISKLVKADDTPSITEDELIDIIDTAEDEGVVNEDQSDLLKSAMQFSENTAINVMVPKDQVLAIPVNTSPQNILEIIRDSNHTRIPVFERDMDHILGYLQIRTFLKEYLSNHDVDIRTLLTPAFFVRPNEPIDELLTVMRQHQFYMAIVSEETKSQNEYTTTTLGILTIEDFLETLVGDIWDESDTVDQSFEKLGGSRYRVDTHMTVGEAFEKMNCPPPDQRYVKMPLLAWLIERLQHMPKLGEEITYRNMTIIVDEIKGHRASFLEFQINTNRPFADMPTIPESKDASKNEEVSS